MEFLEGLSLADLITSMGRTEVAPAVGLLLPAISAVAAGHAQGAVHRDLRSRRQYTVPSVISAVDRARGDGVTHEMDRENGPTRVDAATTLPAIRSLGQVP